MTYNLFQHRHNFAVWAAARASQRRFTSVENLKAALEQCGVVGFLKSPAAFRTDKAAFEGLHRRWCRSIVDCLNDRGIREVTFGRAAKLIAVYFKSMVVVGGHHDCELAKVAHPPVDSILLQNLAQSPEIVHPDKQAWRYTRWTQLDEDDYYALLAALGSCLKEGEPMWHLERFWTVTTSGDKMASALDWTIDESWLCGF